MTAIEDALTALNSASVARRYGVQPDSAGLERALLALLADYDRVTAERDALIARLRDAEAKIAAARDAVGNLNRLYEYGAGPLRVKIRRVHDVLSGEG